MTSGNELTPTRRARRQSVSTLAAAAAPASSARRAPVPTRWSRRRGVLGVFAAFAAIGFVVAYIGPTGLALTQASAEESPPISLYASSLGDIQTLAARDDAEPAEPATLDRSGYTVYVKPKPTPTPTPTAQARSTGSTSGGWRPPFVTPDPGSAQAIAYDMVIGRGWGEDQFACLVALWKKESGWRVNAYNASSGAYGIPQSLPGNKMASAGADWETNPATQITWGLGYIGARYGTPCGAWDHSQRVGWY
ncbi:lytic transglycosylase domain-containing protein [Microbacterium sp. HD4P20]|uniref:aggregation-promoting factor C-terminal-like domain-containing protein n=1 Tax=Microbacterium sp. HD4P20 TaxID=2864874 RepID=UPI0020A3302F|nr:lytic transglycosylase domain-containing protein [Microbacterium sp. HD4P20]MCP2636704.1 lytic transglycosylase domain-containing protein [Microbacterium sp. HD4P20]